MISRSKKKDAEKPAGEEGEDKVSDGETTADDIAGGDSKQEDFWSISSDILVRHHVNHRTKLFSPLDSKSKPPIPLQYIETLRVLLLLFLELVQGNIKCKLVPVYSVPSLELSFP